MVHLNLHIPLTVQAREHLLVNIALEVLTVQTEHNEIRT